VPAPQVPLELSDADASMGTTRAVAPSPSAAPLADSGGLPVPSQLAASSPVSRTLPVPTPLGTPPALVPAPTSPRTAAAMCKSLHVAPLTPGGSVPMPSDASNTVEARAGCKLPRLDQTGTALGWGPGQQRSQRPGSAALQVLAAKRRCGAGFADLTRGLYETGDKTVEEVTSGVQDAEVAAGDAEVAAGEGAQGASRSVEEASKFNVAQDVLGSDLLCKVMGFLGQEHVFLVIAVCHRWRQMAAGLEERLSDTGGINWPALGLFCDIVGLFWTSFVIY